MIRSGTANSIFDLLDTLRIELTAQGWQAERITSALAIARGDVAATLTVPTPSSWDLAAEPADWLAIRSSHAGAPDAAITTGLEEWPCRFDLITGKGLDGHYCHIVLESPPGTYHHLGCGILDRQGSFSTGEYFHASRWDYGENAVSNPEHRYHRIPFDSASIQGRPWGAVRVDQEALPHWYLGNAEAGSDNAIASGWRQGPATLLAHCSASALVDQTLFWPLMLYARRGEHWSLLGCPPDLCYVSMAARAPGEEVRLGTDTWRCYPVMRKNGAPGEPNSGIWGLAYRVLP